MPTCLPGDLLMITRVGAYGAPMASTHNPRALTAEAQLDKARYCVVRRCQTSEEMVAAEQLPPPWCVA